MKIKGTAVKTILDYISEVHPEKKTDFLKGLPSASNEIFVNPIISSGWYDMDESMIIPTEKLGEMLGVSVEDAAWKLGRFSSEKLLKGAYKIFIRVSSPLFVLQRASNVMKAHYNPGNVAVIAKTKNSAVLKLTDFGDDEKFAAHRIGGWIEKTIEITGFKNVKVTVSKENSSTDANYLISPEWY